MGENERDGKNLWASGRWSGRGKTEMERTLIECYRMSWKLFFSKKFSFSFSFSFSFFAVRWDPFCRRADRVNEKWGREWWSQGNRWEKSERIGNLSEREWSRACIQQDPRVKKGSQKVGRWFFEVLCVCVCACPTVGTEPMVLNLPITGGDFPFCYGIPISVLVPLPSFLST